MAIELLNIDCMEYMAGLPDNAFDLAIVDPPYGIGITKENIGSRKNVRRDNKVWDSAPPSDEYFSELKRVSKNQIIWGGNYFKQLWPARGFIVWDKGGTFYKLSFADCELAWTSFDCPARIYKQTSLDKYRIHTTQKPVNLYYWLMRNYANPSMRILDTHLGSGSSAIASHHFGCDFVGCEIDPDYYAAMMDRFKAETSQQSLFIEKDDTLHNISSMDLF